MTVRESRAAATGRGVERAQDDLGAGLRTALATFPAGLLLLFHAGRYHPFFADDSLISLRYAERFAEGKGLTWTDGERVEGYSNLTWVLATALLDLLGVDGILAARVLGALGMLGVLWLTAAWGDRSGHGGLLAGAVAAAALALTGSMAVWAIGGLEQPFVALFLLGGVYGSRALLDADTPGMRRLAAASLALLCLSRPDAPLLVGAVLLAFFLARGASRAALQQALRLGVPALVAALGQLAFRLLYYGDYVPNTARAKLAFSAERLSTGWLYLREGLEQLWPLVGVAVVMTLVGRAWQRGMLLAWLPLLAWAAYVVFIGGDIFPGRRHLTPLIALLGPILASGLAGTARRGAVRVGAAAIALSALTLAYQVRLSLADPANQRAIDERWEWDCGVIGELLRRGFRAEQPLLAADAAGCMPYFSKLPSLDMLGLNDRYLATHPPADLGKGWLGHELGNGRYVFDRKPDLIALCNGIGACYRSGHELLAMPEFGRDHLVVRFEGRDPHVHGYHMWVRKEGKVGFRREGDALHVPGFLLATAAGVATLDAEGRMGAELPNGADVTLALPSDCAGCRVEADAAPGVIAELTGPRSLRVRADRPTFVRTLTLRRASL